MSIDDDLGILIQVYDRMFRKCEFVRQIDSILTETVVRGDPLQIEACLRALFRLDIHDTLNGAPDEDNTSFSMMGTVKGDTKLLDTTVRVLVKISGAGLLVRYLIGEEEPLLEIVRALYRYSDYDTVKNILEGPGWDDGSNVYPLRLLKSIDNV